MADKKQESKTWYSVRTESFIRIEALRVVRETEKFIYVPVNDFKTTKYPKTGSRNYSYVPTLNEALNIVRQLLKKDVGRLEAQVDKVAELERELVEGGDEKEIIASINTLERGCRYIDYVGGLVNE